ncbi:zinc ABC transporter substrate-binding protein [Thiomicrorhabdus heinhorstiae]|uniref:High-affinity zinc uptake system protein ZnuA n=1 Tax=Thiomicrorhabdus heinhorstiae TaxID=2748010 RepID=A0ABS0BXQ0_9GAMM|nr:zinc ABC transporter substrate-binding protein [Thiomicrorhabdus heinhorstiae]MBF6058572.1 zinc ABC transporter substrate-binding protein [Thiomicrorhabdus heinhorstiae]
MKKLLGMLCGLWILPAMPAKAINITVSVPPLAGMIAPLLDQDDELQLLLTPGASPHGFQLKPSHLQALHTSDLVITVGTPVDAWAQKVKLPDGQTLRMAQLEGIETLPFRAGGIWQKGGHVHADEHEHDEHHEHEQQAADSHKELPPYDGHIWMSVDNARILIQAASRKLQQLKPESSAEIAQRTEDWLAKISVQDVKNQTILNPFQEVPFLVLHDAFHYFEHHYGLNGVGSIRLNPEIAPSLKRILELRARVKAGEVQCIFKEPQFPEKRILAVTKGLEVNTETLDPMGVTYAPEGKQFSDYDLFIGELARHMQNCFEKKRD